MISNNRYQKEPIRFFSLRLRRLIFQSKNKYRYVILIASVLLGTSLLTGSRWVENMAVYDSLFTVGIVLIGIATLLRASSVLYLAGYRNAHLITHGPFSVCRNPIYLSTVLGFVGIAFTTRTITYPIMTLILSGILFLSQIMREETRLLRLHGPRFEMYRERTPRILPKLNLFEEPIYFLISPQEFRRWNATSIWFILGIGFTQIIECLHNSSLLPIFISLY